MLVILHNPMNVAPKEWQRKYYFWRQTFEIHQPGRWSTMDFLFVNYCAPTSFPHTQEMYFCISHEKLTLELYNCLSCVLPEGFGNSHTIGGEVIYLYAWLSRFLSLFPYLKGWVILPYYYLPQSRICLGLRWGYANITLPDGLENVAWSMIQKWILFGVANCNMILLCHAKLKML